MQALGTARLARGSQVDTASINSATAAYLPAPSEAVSSSSWALYLLSPVSTAALCDDLVRGAAAHQESDSAVQYLLLVESYLLLQNKVRTVALFLAWWTMPRSPFLRPGANEKNEVGCAALVAVTAAGP